MPRKLSSLGAATDDPLEIVARARKEAEKAIRDNDRLGLRQAANKGYLAAASVADVAAMKLGEVQPKGQTARRSVLSNLEDAARLKRGSLLRTFSVAQGVLHSDCFHEDYCPSGKSLLAILDTVEAMADDAVKAYGRLRTRRKK